MCVHYRWRVCVWNFFNLVCMHKLFLCVWHFLNLVYVRVEHHCVCCTSELLCTVHMEWAIVFSDYNASTGMHLVKIWRSGVFITKTNNLFIFIIYFTLYVLYKFYSSITTCAGIGCPPTPLISRNWFIAHKNIWSLWSQMFSPCPFAWYKAWIYPTHD